MPAKPEFTRTELSTIRLLVSAEIMTLRPLPLNHADRTTRLPHLQEILRKLTTLQNQAPPSP